MIKDEYIDDELFPITRKEVSEKIHEKEGTDTKTAIKQISREIENYGETAVFNSVRKDSEGNDTNHAVQYLTPEKFLGDLYVDSSGSTISISYTSGAKTYPVGSFAVNRLIVNGESIDPKNINRTKNNNVS